MKCCDITLLLFLLATPLLAQPSGWEMIDYSTMRITGGHH